MCCAWCFPALDRHPGLQLVIGHMGKGLATMLARFDQVLGTVRKAPRSVSQTILEQVHVTTSGFTSLPLFTALLETFGADRIMYSTDYPFMPNDVGGILLKHLPVSPTDLAKIAHGNADRLIWLAAEQLAVVPEHQCEGSKLMSGARSPRSAYYLVVRYGGGQQRRHDRLEGAEIKVEAILSQIDTRVLKGDLIRGFA